jgi:hypothetical protein
MKKFKLFLLRRFNIILTVLLGVIGFSSCDREEPDNDDDNRLMYGTPQAQFSNKSSVFSDENDNSFTFSSDTINVELTPVAEETDE